LWLDLIERIVTAMTGTIILVVLALAIIAALEFSHRRNSGSFAGHSGSGTRHDRDVARTKLDLFALGGKAEPFTHKPFEAQGNVLSLRRGRLFTHNHGRHAA
jgi:hypothetical protein